jgi:phosphoglycerol transferase MdoB-like AlkP superfamily enzyme
MSLTERVRATSRLALPATLKWRLLAYGAFHLLAIWRLGQTEIGPTAMAVALFAWGFLNFGFILLTRRAGLSALLSLACCEVVVALSRLKFDVTWMTLSAFDVLIVDPDTFAFLVTIFPELRWSLVIGGALAVPLLVLVWRLDPFRPLRRHAAQGAALCLAGITSVALAIPEQGWEPFQGVNHVSGFARSGVLAAKEVIRNGWLEADRHANASLPPVEELTCTPPARRPHIVMVLDESSLDMTMMPGIKVPENYRAHFRSADGQFRRFVAEATGGPTWYTEYNVLTGLSVQSFGQMKFFVTRIAAQRISRGLPNALKRCGYRTFSLYPAYGAFLSARRFQAGVGIDKLFDTHDMRASWVEPDSFFFDQAAQLISRERAQGPLFLFAYTVQNHFPWTETVRPDLTPKDWVAPGNGPEVDEYLRRQAMSAVDYRAFVERLKREFLGEPFLIVRFGDHPPALAHRLVEPGLPDTEVARRVLGGDPRWYTTYYAIETLNFEAADLSTATEKLDAPYLPLMVMEAAGLPLDATFAEQKRIHERCGGLFYRCRDGAEARRFNRMLIDAGYIKGL